MITTRKIACWYFVFQGKCLNNVEFYGSKFKVYLRLSAMIIELKKLIRQYVLKKIIEWSATRLVNLLYWSFKVIPYQYPWSWNCLSNSIGGCAPYTSLAGMFRSSTKMTHFLPIWGPNTPFLLLSNLDMIMFWKYYGIIFFYKTLKEIIVT